MSDNATIATKSRPVDPETEAFIEAYLRPPAEYRAYIAERLAAFPKD